MDAWGWGGTGARVGRAVRAGCFLTLAVCALAACTQGQSLSPVARAGDTLALALGSVPDATRANLALTLTDAAGAQRTISVDDAALRAVVQVPPDPLSRALVARETQGRAGLDPALPDRPPSVPEAVLTVVFVDLPQDLATGEARIEARVAGTPVTESPITVEILGPGGAPTAFEGLGTAVAGLVARDGVERAAHVSLVIAGDAPLAAVEAQLTHDRADPGAAHVVTVATPGALNVTSWDDGAVLRVLVTSVRALPETPRPAHQFGVRIAPVPGHLTLAAIKAFDGEGAPVSVRAALIAGRPVFEATEVTLLGATLTISGERLCGYCDGQIAGDVTVEARAPGGDWQSLAVTGVQGDLLTAALGVLAPPLEAVRVRTPGGVTERALGR